jgi:hypothetical protein
MCHERWYRRMREEREASRELWEDFEHTRPMSEPEVPDRDTEVTLEEPEAKPVAAER